MEEWEFTVTLRGTGDNMEGAWDNAVEGFIQEPGAPDAESAQRVDTEAEDD